MYTLIECKVKSTDISAARNVGQKDSSTCPIAISLNRATALKWRVSRSGCFTAKFGRIEFPPEVTRWVDHYDNHEVVKGISFTLKALPRDYFALQSDTVVEKIS